MVNPPFGSVVMVTGASAGVGRATARAFAKKGARVGLLARGREGLEAALAEVKEAGGAGHIIQADVSDPVAVEAAAGELEGAFGPIDVWVNNAMVTVFAPFKEVSPDEFRRVTEVTYLGVVYGTMAALHSMLRRDQGIIIQVGSALAYRSIPLQSAYCGAKHAIMGFTDSLRSELLHDRSIVKLSMVQLPALNTPQFTWSRSRLPRKSQPVPPIFQPEVAADAIVWLSEHPRRELSVGMPTLKAIWGQKFAPGFIDKYLAETGYEGQQYDGPADPAQADNLWQALPGDYGAHGEFDDRAESSSLQLWLNKHRNLVGVVGSALVAAAGTRMLAGRRSSPKREVAAQRRS